MEELFYRYNSWWEGDFKLPGILERPSLLAALKQHLNSPQIVFLAGLRRVGKTTLLRLFIKYLIEQERIDPKYIFYISLDDYLLSKKTIGGLVEEYRKIHRLKFHEKSFFFFDEVWYQKDAEIQLKNLFDSQHVKIYASASSASIFRSKKPYLTGRSVVLEISPLDFNEYLSFKNIIPTKADSHLLDRYFEDYMCTGGIPEYVLRGDPEYLKELVDDIIQKDIAIFYSVKNTSILKDYFLLLMERAGKVLSINKIARILKISPDTAKRYLQMFLDTYLIHSLSRCGKTNERIRAPKKIYAADLGIRTLFTGIRDKGSLFENYVYFRLKNRGLCYLYEQGLEIDFLTDDKVLVEVKYHSEFAGKQRSFFEKVNVKKKVIISNIRDIEQFFPSNRFNYEGS